MSAPGESRRALPRWIRVLLGLASRVVPAGRRKDWRREWTAELQARAAGGRGVARPALGSVPHAIWLGVDGATVAVGGLLTDARIAARSLARRPLHAAAASLTLALGIGATAAVFSVVDGVLLAPLPHPGSDRWVRVTAYFEPWDMSRVDLTETMLLEWRRGVGLVEAMEAYAEGEANLVGAGTPVVVHRTNVTSGFLGDLLGMRAFVGRLAAPDEYRAGASDVVMISESLWRERFGGDPAAVGTHIRLDDRSLRIVGVVPTVSFLPSTQVWTPLPLEPQYERASFGRLVSLARLRPGVAREEALTALTASAKRAGDAHPKALANFSPELGDHRESLVEAVRDHLTYLFGAVLAVLLIAALNVASLMLARGLERAPEFALRRSLGAGRAHLMSQALAEGLWIASAGALGGLALARLLLDALLRRVPAEIPLAPTIGIDGRTLAFTAVVAALCGVAAGAVPTLRASRGASGAAAQARGTASRSQRRSGSVLLGLEVAQAAALLVTAGLMVGTLRNMSAAPPGFDADGLLFAHLDLPGYAYESDGDGTSRAVFMQRLRERLAGLPGVRSVGAGTGTPFSGMTFMTGVEQEGGPRPGGEDPGLHVGNPTDGPPRIWFSRLHVDDAYLGTLALPIVEGRSFTPEEMAGSGEVALINETAARAFWAGESPIGRRIRENEQWVTIVGVVSDFGHPGLPTQGWAELYRPMRPERLASTARPTVLIRTTVDASALVEPVRRAIWSVDPDLPIPAVATAASELGASLALPGFYATLFGLFAVIGVTLASVGIFGVTSQSVTRRTRELGIRVALGAPVQRVARMVVREGLTVTTLGLVAGLGVAAAASRLLDSLLFGVSPTDPATYALVFVLVVSVAGLAAWIPARRTLRTDPAAALRTE